MHRLFAAIRPPAFIRKRLMDAMHGIAAVRWQDDDQLHLTLKFIGEIDRHAAEDVAAALGSVHHRPFSVSLSGLGRFERRGKGALWVGVTPNEELQMLHKKVDQACRRLGVEGDTRAFHPHITIARFGRGAGPIDSFVETSGGIGSPPFLVDSFLLYESTLTPQGPVYTLVERYLLA